MMQVLHACRSWLSKKWHSLRDWFLTLWYHRAMIKDLIDHFKETDDEMNKTLEVARGVAQTNETMRQRNKELMEENEHGLVMYNDLLRQLDEQNIAMNTLQGKLENSEKRLRQFEKTVGQLESEQSTLEREYKRVEDQNAQLDDFNKRLLKRNAHLEIQFQNRNV